MATGNSAPKGFFNRTGAFLITFVMLFALTYGFLAAVDALPEPTNSGSNTPIITGSSHTITNTPATPVVAELPVRIAAMAIGMNVTVLNPTSTNVETLDANLLKGAVRYPTSAQLGVQGTMLVFGHSSYLPIVHNQNYKAFNAIQNLKRGDVVSVYSATQEYRYSVTGMRVADATEDVIELPTTGKHLVLVTCDSFKSKSSRFVVTADFVGTYAITN
jgi:LPXTG-site transpeptidase (sortase) family protein